MIISIRGTSGSGKSTLVRQLMNDSMPLFELNNLVGHQCDGFRVVGPYPSDVRLAAGVDILNRTRRRSELYDQIQRWAVLGDVVYEGLLVSNEVGRTAQQAQIYPTVVIFLNTPLDVCLERINERRKSKAPGSLFDEEPEAVNPRNTTEKFRELARVAERLEKAGVIVVHQSCEDALAHCRKLLK
jgi:thymidylate kinase